MPAYGFESLNEAGLEGLPEEQRIVFEQLTPDELRVVNVIQERLNAAAPEVQGHTDESTNNNCLC
jgi:hypothetical protein